MTTRRCCGSASAINSYVSLDGSGELVQGEAIGASPWVDFARSQFFEMLANEDNLSLPQQMFRLASMVNLSDTDPGPGYSGMALKMANLTKGLTGGNPTGQFINLVANTITHEAGHVLGAIHSRDHQHAYIHSDVMGPGSVQAMLTFRTRYTGLMKAALGLPMDENEFGVTIEYYRQMLPLENYPFSVPHHGEHEFESGGPILDVLDAPVAVGQPEPAFVTRVDLVDHDRLVITGAATLAGTVAVALTGGFEPALGNVFDVLTYASQTGTLAFTGLDLGGGVDLDALIEAARVRLTGVAG